MLGLGLGIPQASARGRTTDPLPDLIASLFGNGEQGAFFLARPEVDGQQVLFRDEAGTEPVTAVGDPVGRNSDLSGNANHAEQGVSGARPSLLTLTELAFDGVADRIVVAAPSGLLGADVYICVAMKYKGDGTLSSVVAGGGSSYTTVINQGSSGYPSNTYTGGTTYVDQEVAVDRDDLYQKLSDGEYHVVEVVGADLTNWPLIAIGALGDSDGDATAMDLVGAVIARSTDSGKRQAARRYLAGLAGVTGI